MKKRCKICKQLIPKLKGRFCCKCGLNILSHDKWFFNIHGRVQHRDCKNPTKYPR